MRLMVYKSDNKARMVLRQTDGTTNEISNTFTLPEGRWLQLSIAQKISDTAGWTKVYLDGALVAQGSGDTYSGHPVTRLRYGFADCSGQTRPLTVYVDKVTVYTGTEEIPDTTLLSAPTNLRVVVD
jgi:hypothetical protein